MKVCGKCNQEKMDSKFSGDKRNKDGLQYYCKACRAYIASNKHKDSDKVCSTCKVSKPRSETYFLPCRTTKDKLSKQCRQCIKSIARECKLSTPHREYTAEVKTTKKQQELNRLNAASDEIKRKL